MYEISTPSGRLYSPPPGRAEGCWSLTEPEFIRLRDEQRIWFGKNGDTRPRVKTYLSESEGVSAWTWWKNKEVGESEGVSAWTWWKNKEVGDNQSAKKELIRLMGPRNGFEYPKPTSLILRILAIATTEQSIVLDSFAGSGPTAHAVLEANKRDGGNRRFILVEMEDYADRLTAERVRRVVRGYEFSGTQRTELMREKITWSRLQKARKLTETVEKIENLHGHEYEEIKKKVKDGELIVTGENKVAERAEGLGGTFTYCTLGDPVELDKVLSGKTLPSYASIGAALFHMATNRALDPATVREDDFYLGATEGYHVWLIYRPDLEWLKTPEAALTLARAKAFTETDPEKRHLVFAPARYVSQKMLADENIPVEFVPLPFALYRIDRS